MKFYNITKAAGDNLFTLCREGFFRNKAVELNQKLIWKGHSRCILTFSPNKRIYNIFIETDVHQAASINQTDIGPRYKCLFMYQDYIIFKYNNKLLLSFPKS